MQHGFQRVTLAPDGLAEDAVQLTADRVQVLRSRQPWESALAAATEASVCKAPIGARA